MKEKYLYLTIILIVFIIAILSKNETTIYYDYSNKTIDKNELIEYKDNNKCRINKNVLGSASNNDYDKVFNKEIIQDVYIDIPEINLYYLFENAIDKPQVYINSIKIGNNKMNCSSIKTKGHTTLSSLWINQHHKFSFTINFKKYIKEQNLYGLNKISFNNMYFDPSMLKEYISYYLFNEIGLETVDYSYVNLYINKEYYGIYFMIEPIDKALIKRTLKESGNFLFKPELDGADLVYRDELDEYIDSNGEYNFDNIVYNDRGEFEYPRNSNLILNTYRGIWEDDPESFKKIYGELSTFFKTLKKLNYLSNLDNKNTKYYEEQLESIIDVDKLIRYMAVNNFLVNTDGYVNTPARNYSLYMNKEGFLTIIPWDYNMILGSSILNNSSDVINYNVYNPTIDCNLEDRPLLRIIMENDNYKERYNKYLNDINIIAYKGGTTSFDKKYKKKNINYIIKKYSKELIKNNNRSRASIYNEEEIKLAQKNLKIAFKLRTEAVGKQINGIEEEIYSDFDLYSLGNIYK